jgi:hypothetical protein
MLFEKALRMDRVPIELFKEVLVDVQEDLLAFATKVL